MGKREMIRQGDVLLIPITETQIAYARPVPADRVREDGVVLAFGEATGHSHVAHGPVTLNIGNDRQWSGRTIEEINVEKDTEIVHEEHGTIPLRKGLWEVRRQREYAGPERARTVWD